MKYLVTTFIKCVLTTSCCSAKTAVKVSKVLATNKSNSNTCHLQYSFHFLLLLCLTNVGTAHFYASYATNSLDVTARSCKPQLYDIFGANVSTTTATTKVFTCASTQLASNKSAVAFKTQQYRQQHRFDNKTNDNNFYSNIEVIGVQRFMRIVCVYMIALSLVEFIGSLQHAACIYCLKVKQYFYWFSESCNKIISYQKSSQVLQERKLQVEMQKNVTAATVIITSCQWNMKPIFLFTYRLFCLYEQTKITTTTTTSLATTSTAASGEALLIMWLLHLVQGPQNDSTQQERQQQEQQKQFVAYNVQQNQNSPRKCSEYCGNMYQKITQSPSQQQHLETTIHNQQQQHLFAFKLLLQRQRIGSLTIVAINSHKLPVSSSSNSLTATFRVTMGTTLKMYAHCKQDYRCRRRKRKRKQLGIGSSIFHTQLVRRRISRLMWRKQLQKQQHQKTQQKQQEQHAPKTKTATTCCAERLQLNSRKSCRWVWSCCICCNNGNSRCSLRGDNINTINGNSSGGTSDNNNYNNRNNNKSTNNNTSSSSSSKIQGNNNARECCCCCCCCCHYYYYYCCCCCCCCCDSYCHFCCCSCSCDCCHQQQQQHKCDSNTNQYNRVTNFTYNNTTNTNCNTTKPDKQHKQSQHKKQQKYQKQQNQYQQQQQYNQKAYYQRQHKRQKQQHIFYQQHNCYHRRRRRHFCASYTSLHSCCCCFFKWICWRHHNFRKRVIACIISSKYCQKHYQHKCFQRMLLFSKYCQLTSKEFRPVPGEKSSYHRQQQLQPKINVTGTGNVTSKSIKDYNKCKRHRRRFWHTIRQEQYYKHEQQCSGKYVVTATPLEKIANNLETCSTITQGRITAKKTSNVSKSRMLKRLFRRHWVWLMIGLVWLEGPKLAHCNAIADIGATEKNGYPASFNNSNNCSSSSSSNCMQPALSLTLAQSLADTSLPEKVLLRQRLPSRSSKQRSNSLPEIATVQTPREQEYRQQNDSVRLESIKHQILSKLGLKSKPNVTHPLPKQFIWDTIYRADGISSVSDFDFNDDHRAQQVKLLKYTTTEHRKSNNRVARAHSNTNFVRRANFIESDDVEVTGDLFDLEVDNEDVDVEEDEEEVFLQNSQKHGNNLLQKPLTQSRKYQPQVQQQQQQKLHNKFYYYMDKTSKTLRKTPESYFHHQDTSSKHRYAESSRQKYAAPIQTENALYEPDDYYGSTQEIITFAEKGEMYKKHRLVEFSSPKHEVPAQQLHIQHAEIHIRIDKVPQMLSAAESNRKTRNTKLKLWIFQLMAGDYTQRGFDQVARFCTSLNVEQNALGWQKLDMTETVQFWYERSAPNDKLRLLIDCTGCGQYFVLHLFDVYNRTSAQKVQMPQHGQHQRRKAHNLRRSNQLISAQMFNGTRSASSKTAATIEVVHKLRKQRHRYKHWSNSDELHQQEIFNNYKTQYPVDWHNNNKNVLTAQQKQQKGTIAEPAASSAFEHLEDGLNPNRPFLVLHTEPKRARRVRRRVIDCAGALHGQCCKESFYVSFKALGWDDWIIAPRGYFANYCRGDCSGPYRTPDTFQTFHAHFIEEYRKLGLLNGMQPCCAPVKFSSMSLIYYGDDGIIKRDLPKMVVDECGCP